MKKKNWQTAEYRRNRLKVLKDNPFCVRCGDIATTAQHKVPRSLDGSNKLSNLESMCLSCNSALGNGLGRASKKRSRINPKWVK